MENEITIIFIFKYLFFTVGMNNDTRNKGKTIDIRNKAVLDCVVYIKIENITNKNNENMIFLDGILELQSNFNKKTHKIDKKYWAIELGLSKPAVNLSPNLSS